MNINDLTIGALFENTDFGTDTLAATKAAAAEQGYEIDVEIQYPNSASDLSSEVLKLKSEGVDILLQGSYVSDAILFVQTMEDLDFNPQAIITTGGGYTDPAWLEAVGEGSNYIISADVWTKSLEGMTPVVGDVNRMFIERYGSDMESVSSRSFTAVFVLADALERAASTEKVQLREALRETDIPGEATIMAWEGIKFNEVGANIFAKNLFKQVQDAEYLVVWPGEVAVIDLVWPMPPWDSR